MCAFLGRSRGGTPGYRHPDRTDGVKRALDGPGLQGRCSRKFFGVFFPPLMCGIMLKGALGEIWGSVGAVKQSVHLRSFVALGSRNTKFHTYQTLNELCLPVHHAPCVLRDSTP